MYIHMYIQYIRVLLPWLRKPRRMLSCNIHAQLRRFHPTMSCHVMPKDSKHLVEDRQVGCQSLAKNGSDVSWRLQKNLS